MRTRAASPSTPFRPLSRPSRTPVPRAWSCDLKNGGSGTYPTHQIYAGLETEPEPDLPDALFRLLKVAGVHGRPHQAGKRDRVRERPCEAAPVETGGIQRVEQIEHLRNRVDARRSGQ